MSAELALEGGQKAERLILDAMIRERVHDEVVQEEDKRFRQLRAFVAVVGLVGLGTFGTLSSYLIEKAVDTQIRNRAGEISDEIHFLRFARLSERMERESSFSDADRDAAMTYLRSAAEKPLIRQNPEFVINLFQVMHSFVSAGLSPYVDELFQLYEREILGSAPLTESLLHHYGQQLIGRSVDPRFGDSVLEAFEQLEAIAPSRRQPELALYYRSLFEWKHAEGDKERVAAFVARVGDQLEVDRARYVAELLQRSRAENWVNGEPTAEAREIERVVRSFLRAFAAELASTTDVDANIFAAAGQDGVAEEDAEAASGIEL